MTAHQYDEFLYAVLIICALGAMLNVSKFKTRGASARYLAGAFVSMGVGVWLMRINANRSLIGLMGGLTFGLLAAEFALRIKAYPRGRAK